MNQLNLEEILLGCSRDNRLSQKQLYKMYYNYGMRICSRYARSDEEAQEMLNDAFLRVFTRIHLYDPSHSFSSWFNTICIRSSINYLKKYTLQENVLEITEVEKEGIDTGILSQLSVEHITKLIQKLAVSYRLVFNLSVLEGYSHSEIALMLGITEGTSRSNLMIARQKMQAMILKADKVNYE